MILLCDMINVQKGIVKVFISKLLVVRLMMKKFVVVFNWLFVVNVVIMELFLSIVSGISIVQQDVIIVEIGEVLKDVEFLYRLWYVGLVDGRLE